MPNASSKPKIAPDAPSVGPTWPGKNHSTASCNSEAEIAQTK